MDRPGSHSQKVPYARKEGRKSLFSKVKDSMRDMLSPSWLSDIVTSVKKESPPKVTQDNATAAPPFSGGVPQQSMVPNAPGVVVTPQTFAPYPGQSLVNGQPRTLDFSNQSPALVPSPYQTGAFLPPVSEFTSAQLPLNRLAEKTDSVMAQEDTMSQRSDSSKSTSGCSSMVPQTDPGPSREKRKASVDIPSSTSPPQEQPSNKRQKLQVSISGNQTFSRRLGDTFVQRNSASAGSRPAFNTSLFASPLQNDTSLLGTSFHESSFYPGKTVYGGRSSMSFSNRKKKVDLNQSLPGRLSVPVKAFMKAKPRVNSNKEAVTSSTAKRILEALDRMPTPVNDAKRIPVMPGSWTESTVSSRSGPPTQNLNISAQASISRNRQVSFSSQTRPSTGTVPLMPRQDTVLVDSEAASGSRKMTRDKSYHRGSASAKPTTLEEADTVIIPDLKTDFTLPVGSMPKFAFSAPSAKNAAPAVIQSKPPATMMAPPTSSQGAGISTEATPNKLSLNFTFSSPIQEMMPANKPASPQAQGGFQFSSPISVDKQQQQLVSSTKHTPFSQSAVNFSTPPSMAYDFTAKAKPKPKSNGPTSLDGGSGGHLVASELKQGSVMDILGGGGFSKPKESPSSSINGGSVSQASSSKGGMLFGKSTTSASAPPLSAMFKSSGWQCDVCLVDNKQESEKCIACQTSKPASKTPASNVQDSSGDLMAKFQTPSGQWSCDTCLLQNKPDLDKCIACQTPKPAANSQISKVSDNGSDLLAMFKTPAGQWSCDVCMVQNKPDLDKCVCCQTPNPASSKPVSLFKSGSVLPGNWICQTCLIQNKKVDNICGACKTAKSTDTSTTTPASSNKDDSLMAKFKPAAGQWECEVCMVQNKTDTSTCIACQSAKPSKAFKPPPGDWTCDTCLVENKATDNNCIACSYARPGPPRTLAVPSCANSFTTAQSGKIEVMPTGGFSFKSSSSEPAKSGFSFNTTTSESKSNDLSGSTGGFKFDSGSSSANSSTGAGFKFGSDSVTKASENSSSTGGFKFGGENKTSNNAGGFKFGDSDAKTGDKKEQDVNAQKVGGFSFTQPSESSQNSVSSSQSSITPLGGFTFGSKPEGIMGSSQTSSSSTVGFGLKSTDSSLKTSDNDTKSNSLGGFNIPSATSSSSLPANSAGGFAFTATKITESSATTTVETTSKPAFRGYTFGQGSSEPAKPAALGGFTFGAAQPASDAGKTATPGKRGRDEDTGETASKKSFSFGQATNGPTSAPFQLNSAAANTGASSVPGSLVFGQKPAESTANSSLFAFGAGKPSAPSSSITPSVFGSALQASSASTVTPVFGSESSASATTMSSVFGQPAAASTTSGVFGQPASGMPSSVFGQAASTTSSVFGQSSGLAASTGTPVFGQSAASTAAAAAPVFQFGQNSTPTTTSSLFAFGGSSVQSTTTAAAPTFNTGTPVFNFGQKPDTSTTSAQVFKFGAAPESQPPATTTPFAGAFGTSNNTGSTGIGPAFGGNALSTTPSFGATPPAFGTNATPTATPSFGGFGSSQPVAPASGVFQFGAKPAESSSAPAQPGFTFGAPGGGANFNFQNQSAQPANPFSAGSSGTPTTEGRKIKKATRRIKR